MSNPEKIIVGLSGGVDSAVAALLLQREGFEVEGLFMKNWEEDDTADYCSASEDLADAEAVAERLKIKLHRVNFSSEYWDRVFAQFLTEYQVGRTPNPDVLCNREIKFSAFLEHAMTLGGTGIATGHYARVRNIDDRVQLCRARDENKDQTYFLYMLQQTQLALSRFPLSDISKSQVRQLAREAKLSNYSKKDSTGICFIGAKRFQEFLSQFVPANPGRMMTPEGKHIGIHQGLMFYTLGQRKGLGIGGCRQADEAPWYVVEKDLENNILLVAQEHDHPLLMKQALSASQAHWISGESPKFPLSCQARIRHRQALQNCSVYALGSHDFRVEFEKSQRAVTPGQSVVLYQSDVCLGGGIIERSS